MVVPAPSSLSVPAPSFPVPLSAPAPGAAPPVALALLIPVSCPSKSSVPNGLLLRYCFLAALQSPSNNKRRNAQDWHVVNVAAYVCTWLSVFALKETSLPDSKAM